MTSLQQNGIGSNACFCFSFLHFPPFRPQVHQLCHWIHYVYTCQYIYLSCVSIIMFLWKCQHCQPWFPGFSIFYEVTNCWWWTLDFNVLIGVRINVASFDICWHRLVPLMSRLWWMHASSLNVRWRDSKFVRKRLKQKHFLKKALANSQKLWESYCFLYHLLHRTE